MAEILCSLLRLGIGTATARDKDFEGLLCQTMQEWRDVMALAARQGVAAIAFDGVQRLYNVYGKEIAAAKTTPTEWMQWVFECTGMMSQYEQRNKQQKEVISEIANIWVDEGIKMMVFKGQANAAFYPAPEHRATGDIDCWLYGEAERGDSIMKLRGAAVDFSWYRHSKISFHGETIENHRVLSHTRGDRKKKEMEEELRLMVQGLGLKVIEGCEKALMPSAQFNACFLTYHGLHHFISEGLRMKQILDWAMFLEKEQGNVDWALFNGFCKRYKLDRFAAVMNYIASEYLNVDLNRNILNTNDHEFNTNYQKTIAGLAERVIQSTLYDDDYLFNSGKSDWKVRWLLVKNMFTRDRWKYRDIAQQNVWKHLWQSTRGFLCKND